MHYFFKRKNSRLCLRTYYIGVDNLDASFLCILYFHARRHRLTNSKLDGAAGSWKHYFGRYIFSKICHPADYFREREREKKGPYIVILQVPISPLLSFMTEFSPNVRSLSHNQHKRGNFIVAMGVSPSLTLRKITLRNGFFHKLHRRLLRNAWLIVR